MRVNIKSLVHSLYLCIQLKFTCDFMRVFEHRKVAWFVTIM